MNTDLLQKLEQFLTSADENTVIYYCAELAKITNDFKLKAILKHKNRKFKTKMLEFAEKHPQINYICSNICVSDYERNCADYIYNFSITYAIDNTTISISSPDSDHDRSYNVAINGVVLVEEADFDVFTSYDNLLMEVDDSNVIDSVSKILEIDHRMLPVLLMQLISLC